MGMYSINKWNKLRVFELFFVSKPLYTLRSYRGTQKFVLLISISFNMSETKTESSLKCLFTSSCKNNKLITFSQK